MIERFTGLTGIALAIELPWSLAVLGEDHGVDESARSRETEMAARVHDDPEQFLALYEGYYERILNYLYRRTGNRETAEDLTSQTFLLAFEHLSSARRRVNFRPWIYTIATNAFRSHSRRGRRWHVRVPILGRMGLDAGLHDGKEDVIRKDLADTSRALLLRLPEKYREALMLRFDEDLPYRDIAEIVGLSPVGVRTRVLRGLDLLRKGLEGS